MTEPTIGCAGFGPGRPPWRYFEQLDAVELVQTFVHPPKATTLTRWRESAPEGFVFVVKAWQLVTHEPSSPSYHQLPHSFKGSLEGAGHLQDSEVVRQALARTVEVADALDAAALLFDTPPSFSPTLTHRRALARFFERCDRRRALFWSPSGLWHPAEVRQVCRDLQLVAVRDPFAHAEREEALDRGPDQVCFRPLGLGGTCHSDDQLRWLADLLASRPDAFCLFGSPSLFDEARRLQELLVTPP